MGILKRSLVLCLIVLNITSLFTVFSTLPVSGEVPWKWQSYFYDDWYYDNLDAADRTKIRNAIDFLIPRDYIVNQVHLGFATKITSPIGVNFVDIYNYDLVPRTYNLSKASELLTEVFGYEYDPYIEFTNESTKITPEPYFRITIACPTDDIIRTQYASLISSTLNSVGIETSLDWWSWDIIMPRIFLDPVGTGYDYEHGGYDMFFVGYDTSPDPTYKEYYDKSTFSPSSNCYWIEDGPATSGKYVTTGPGTNGAYPNITALWIDFYKEMNYATRAEMLKEYQQWCYDNIPTCIISQKKELWAMDTKLQGFDLFHGIQQQICNWRGIGTNVTIVHSGDYVDFNPLLSDNYIDTFISSNAFCSLSRRRGDYNLSHPIPWLAENWTHSADYKTWTVNLRQGIKWSDNTSVTADDVIFSYHAILNNSLAAPGREALMNILGNDTGVDGKYIFVTKGINDYQVIFTLPQVYTYVETILFGVEIIQKTQLESIGLTNWKTHGTNNGSIPIIGCGPYQMVSYDGTKVVKMEKNPYYNGTLMGHNETMVGGGNCIPDPTITNITFEVVKSATSAITGLENGLYDVIDSQMEIQSQFGEIDGSSWGKILTYYKWSYEELAFNHYNPIFGMNPHDPARMYPNRYTRNTNTMEWIGIILFSLIFYLSLAGIPMGFFFPVFYYIYKVYKEEPPQNFN